MTDREGGRGGKGGWVSGTRAQTAEGMRTEFGKGKTEEAGGLIGRKLTARAILKRIRDSRGSRKTRRNVSIRSL